MLGNGWLILNIKTVIGALSDVLSEGQLTIFTPGKGHRSGAETRSGKDDTHIIPDNRDPLGHTTWP
jgi:hypothetical protein